MSGLQFDLNEFLIYVKFSKPSIRPIIASTEYFDVNCMELKPTNMHVLLKSKQKISDEHFQQHDTFKLPSMCRVTMLNIVNDSDDNHHNCCQNLLVYDDVEETTLTIGEKSKTATNSIESELSSKFYECDVLIKGFKNMLVKGQSIWTK